MSSSPSDTVPKHMCQTQLGRGKLDGRSKKSCASSTKTMSYISVFVALLFAFALLPLQGSAQATLEGSLTFGAETTRKTCTSCVTDETENEIEATLLELVIRPQARADLSFGIAWEYDFQSEGDLFGSGRLNPADQAVVSTWARRQFNETYWGQIQAAWDYDEDFVEVGGALGFDLELENDLDLSAFINLDRRLRSASDSRASEGTYIEVGARFEWEWDERGAWLELTVDHWTYKGDADDETLVTLQPGVSFDLWDSPHTGLVWLEGERGESGNVRTETLLIGLGAAFELGDSSDLLLGGTLGQEREYETGEPTRKSRVQGLIAEYSFRF